ncbi:MAG: phage integrase N-terminal SAM-like domain-containing protein [Deltaproteobacteria bacterium]|nr:phage integrase N-terminal SAM-like domain-containing protein [Deltaproteobacteria bacterium]
MSPRLGGTGAPAAGPVLPPASSAPKPKLLDQVRDAILTPHHSRRTEDADVGWVKRFIFFHGKRHPAEMEAEAVIRFLSSLAVRAGAAENCEAVHDAKNP